MKHLTVIIILTFIINHKVPAQQVDSKNYTDCGLSQQAIKLAQLIIESSNQQRTELYCNQKISQAALHKAKLMAKANDVNHRIEHTTPNQLLRGLGIKLPSNYPLFDNQVEAIMGGVATAQESFNLFMTSPDHKSHLLGENEFVLEQDQIGVGYFKDNSSDHVYYWVVYITQINTAEN